MNNKKIEEYLDHIDKMFSQEMMTIEEANAIKQALKLPISNVKGKRLPQYPTEKEND